MVQCTCGKPMDKVPDWLQSVQVEFVCNNCPKRSVKSITQLTPEELMPTAKFTETEELAGIELVEEEEEE